MTPTNDERKLADATRLNLTAYWSHPTPTGHRVLTPHGIRAAKITGEADTYFSIPATVRLKGHTIKGYITSDEIKWENDFVKFYYFRPYEYDNTLEAIALAKWPESEGERRDAQAKILADYLKS